MNVKRIMVSAMAGLLLAGPAHAQDDAEERQQAANAARDAQQLEQQLMREQERIKQIEKEVEMTNEARSALADKEAIRIEMLQAEEKLAEAARRIAELSQQNLPRIQHDLRAAFVGDGRPRLGVTIAGNDESGPVEGVQIGGVTPGSAAEDAGLRAGDVLTRVNDEALSAESGEAATRRLLDFMSGVEAGDKLKIEYLRKGKVGTVELEPKVIERRTFVFRGPDGGNMEFFGDGDVDVHVAPDMVERFRFDLDFPWVGNAWGNMEMVELNEGLGRYFGTSEGLLIISVAESNDLQLEDGDVLQSIDDREPTSVGHAMRILGSYEPGEEITLAIMRDKKRRTLKVTMPDKHSSAVVPPLSPLAPASPVPGIAPAAAVPAVVTPRPAPLGVVPVPAIVAPDRSDTRT